MSPPLLRRFGLVLSLTLIGGSAGLTYAVKAPPDYTARAYVVTTGADAVTYAPAYGRVATSGPVLARAATLLGDDPSGLDRVTAATAPSAPVIEVAARSRSATRAATLANAVARALAAYGSAREPSLHVGLTVLAPATAPARPSSPSLACALVLGTSAGLLAGAVAALLTLRRSRPAYPISPRPATFGWASPEPASPEPASAEPASAEPASARTASARAASAQAASARPTFDRPAEIAGHLRVWRPLGLPGARGAFGAGELPAPRSLGSGPDTGPRDDQGADL